jgi:predicted MFS family arabinose efflux permease
VLPRLLVRLPERSCDRPQAQLPKKRPPRRPLLHLREDGAEPTTSWSVLRDKENRRFVTYFWGSVISDLGTWLQNTAQVLLAYRFSHSVLAVGLVTFAQFSSPLVLGPWSGVVSDKFGGRRTLLGTQMVACLLALALALLEFANRLNVTLLVIGAILSGLCFTFALPPRNVTVRRLIPDENQLRPAFVMDAVSYNIGRAIAPLMGIGIALWVGFGWAFVGNAISFAIFTAILWWVGRGSEPEPARRSRLWDGFMIVRKDGRIMVLLAMVAAVTIADDPILVLGPTLSSKMHLSVAWSGLFIASLGAGSVLGSVRRSKHLPTLGLAATSLALLGACMVVFVSSPWLPVSIVAAIGAGVCCLIANSATRTLLSKAAGPEQVASVMAIWAVAWAGSKPIASITDGLLASWVGVPLTGILLALPTLIPIVVFLGAPRFGRKVAGRGRPLIVTADDGDLVSAAG